MQHASCHGWRDHRESSRLRGPKLVVGGGVPRQDAGQSRGSSRSLRGWTVPSGRITFLEWIRALAMSVSGSPRRDQRRRLVLSWNRTPVTGTPTSAAVPRPMAAYAPEAHPDRQRGPATLIPTGLGGFTLVVLAMLLPMAAVLVVGGCEPLLGRPVFRPTGRFAGTVAAAATCFDPRSAVSISGWLAQLSLLIAASTAAIVRLMRRHRRDDYNGRYRAWGWLAGLFLIASCTGQVPLGRLVGVACAEATGLSLGPRGAGWWVAIAATLLTAVSLWAILPLYERGATAFWLGLGLTSWAVSAACDMAGGGRDVAVIVGHASWALGASLSAVAMLAAARSVIREVQGIASARPVGASERRKRSAAPAAAENDAATTAPDEEPDFHPEPVDESGQEQYGGATPDDEPEHEHRHLSKAERKRLKKLARMNRSAA